MPRLSRNDIAAYLHTECPRRLALDMRPNTRDFRRERLELEMPPENVRPGIQILRATGIEWQRQKLSDLAETFGRPALVGRPTRADDGCFDFSAIPIGEALAGVQAGQFVVEGQLEVTGAFERALGIEAYRERFRLVYSDLKPDLVHVLRAGTFTRAVQPDGSLRMVEPGDPRLGLQIIDIKLTAEPTVPYYVQVTYYAMALAGWLVERGFQGCFHVIPEAAVWPGSHDASNLVRTIRQMQQEGHAPTPAELLDALRPDLDVAAFQVFAPRLKRFFQDDLLQVLSTPWRELEWHVDNRCLGCDYLGIPWPGTEPHADHCYPSAEERQHLSRVAFISRGARASLERSEITTVTDLAATQPEHPAFDEHHTLRATRTVVAGRAQSLATRQAAIPDRSGTSAVMPKWADLSLYVICEFDVGSGITVCFGLQGLRYAHDRDRRQGYEPVELLRAQTFPVIDRDLAMEARELMSFLGKIREAIDEALGAKPTATIQVYIWDTVTYQHLVRVIGRHLGAILANNRLQHLAWLFPPEEVLPNPSLVERKSPITIVRDVIRAIVAAPVPHYYSLLSVARTYNAGLTPPYDQFHVNTLFEDPLSDHVPMERAHEIWTRAAGRRPWNEQLRTLETTVRTKLSALNAVRRRVQEDLGDLLCQTAPRADAIGAPAGSARLSTDGLLWYSFAKLNFALESLSCHQVRAMPPHEREARFESARLPERLAYPADQQVLRRVGLQPQAGRWVYTLAARSREVKGRDGDIGFALAPEARPGFLDQTLTSVTGGAAVPLSQFGNMWDRMERVCAVTVQKIDREGGFVVVDVRQDWVPTLLALEAGGHAQFSQNAMLEPVRRDYFTPKLKETLEAIGNPPIAAARAAVTQALGPHRRARAAAATPVADVLWDAARLHGEPTGRDLDGIRELLAGAGVSLNPSQWTAWADALGRRLSLIWGPPGTGKSLTLSALLLGALHAAHRAGRSLRVLLTAQTYEAIDNVFLPVAQRLSEEPTLRLPNARIVRVRSRSRPATDSVPPQFDLSMAMASDVADLLDELRGARRLLLVATTTQQAHSLLIHAGQSAVQPLFDLVVIDEASQMDTANATLALAGLADGGAVVVAGDPKQLPPIHQAEPPLGLERMVGPVYGYFADRHQVPHLVLDQNYRSNATVVEFAHVAEYPQALQSVYPELALRFSSPLPSGAAAPAAWPETLFWTPHWADLLSPTDPCAAFVYKEGQSSQSNQFEADAVAALVWLLRQHLSARLAGMGDDEEQPVPPIDANEFWRRGVGVVTPHRAQQALIVNLLQTFFQGDAPPGVIRSAVDTVERFQGQERSVILATFALGDPDAIRSEDEFLLSLNRFNVMASRAKAKLIVLVTQEVVNHLSSDPDVLRESALLKTYVDYFCNQSREMVLGHLRGGAATAVRGSLRWRACRPRHP